MSLLYRTIQGSLEKVFFKKKVIVIYGARQVGKTTLIRAIAEKYKESAVYLNCDEPDIRASLTNKTSTELAALIGNKQVVLIDEAQRVRNIGLTLKLLIDNYPEKQIVATGSSSFDLSNEIVEPLTGRKIEFLLHPFSLEELKQTYKTQELQRLLERWIVYGMYPEIVSKPGEEKTLLHEISKSSLYKDILAFQNIRYPDILERLLQALALQIGNEVSYNELALLIGINRNTIDHYIQILEQGFIIFRLKPFKKNLRNELSKLRKIYFYDLGIRNALINNFNPINLRQDKGALLENFLILERIKFQQNHGIYVNRYFWRTRQKQEVDYIEETQGEIRAFEFKWNDKKGRHNRAFQEAYPRSTFEVIHTANYSSFVGI